MGFSVEELNKFTEELASDSPTPGGGSVSAFCGALSAALVSMAASFTAGREKYKDKEEQMQKILLETKQLRAEFTKLLQEDINAYGIYAKAAKMPKETETEKEARKNAMQQALLASTETPLKIMEACVKAVQLAQTAALDANQNLISDAGAAAVMALAAAKAASYNVRINLPGILDNSLAAQYRLRMENSLAQVTKFAEKTAQLLDEYFAKLGKGK